MWRQTLFANMYGRFSEKAVKQLIGCSHTNAEFWVGEESSGLPNANDIRVKMVPAT